MCKTWVKSRRIRTPRCEIRQNRHDWQQFTLLIVCLQYRNSGSAGKMIKLITVHFPRKKTSGQTNDPVEPIFVYYNYLCAREFTFLEMGGVLDPNPRTTNGKRIRAKVDRRSTSILCRQKINYMPATDGQSMRTAGEEASYVP